MRLAPLLLVLFVLIAPPPATAQDAPQGEPLLAPGAWRAYPSMRRVQAVAAAPDALWAGTDGGVFRYHPASGEVERVTTVDGLQRADVRALAYDDARSALWIGYDDGGLDRLDTASGRVTSFFDIARAERFPRRGINRLRLQGDSLLVATGFGLVVFDTARGEVRDTYERFGPFAAGEPVYDALAFPLPDGQPGLWVATREGVASAPLRGPILRAPASWSPAPGAPAPARSLGAVGGRLFAGKEQEFTTTGQPLVPGDLYRLGEDGAWSALGITEQTVLDLFQAGDRLVAIAPFSVAAVRSGGGFSAVALGAVHAAGATGPDGGVWLGTQDEGLLLLPPLPQDGRFSVEPERRVVPEGPLTNQITAVQVGRGGEVWVGHLPEGPFDGLSRAAGGRWMSFSTRTGADVARAPIRTILADRRGDVWAGSEGGGLTRVTAEGEVVTYREDNSTLEGDSGFTGLVVALGLAEDADGRIWVTNQGVPLPVHVWTPDRGWTALPRSSELPPAVRRYRGLTIDRFGQKWIQLNSPTIGRGDGFVVLQTGDAFDPSDDRGVFVLGAGSPTTGTGLPDPEVNAIVEDLDGRMWFGTSRGLAYVASPGSVFADPAFLQPTWARTPDGASYFLRDLAIRAIAVDPANRKWLGTTDGVWLINAEGNEVLAHLTPSNSPLPDALVVGIAIDPATGTVYFATDGGLVSYRGDSVAPSARAETLRVFPNPFRPAEHASVRVEGLVAATRIRILTADGQVVAAFDARGGSATWDGRDDRTGQPVPSGVYVVAAAGQDGEGAAYGKIAVIR